MPEKSNLFKVFPLTNKAQFAKYLADARDNDQKHGWSVTPKTADDLCDAKTFVTADGSIGFAIEPDGNLVSVFRNKALCKTPNVMPEVLPQAVSEGAAKLDCYGENLVNIYSPEFRPVCRLMFNAEFANEGWTPDKGTPYIYFMTRRRFFENLSIRRKHFPHFWTKEELDALPLFGSTDYEAAYQYRDKVLAKDTSLDRAIVIMPLMAVPISPFSAVIGVYLSAITAKRFGYGAA